MRAHTERLCATSSYRGVKVDGIFLDPDITGAHLRRVKAHDGVQREADWSQAHKKESDAAYFEFLLITEFKIQLDGWMHYNIPPWFSMGRKTTAKSKHQNMCLFHMFWCFHTEAEVGERGSLWSESEKEGSVMSCGDGRNSATAVVPVSSSASHVNKCTWCTRSVLTVQGQDLPGMS